MPSFKNFMENDCKEFIEDEYVSSVENKDDLLKIPPLKENIRENILDPSSFTFDILDPSPSTFDILDPPSSTFDKNFQYIFYHFIKLLKGSFWNACQYHDFLRNSRPAYIGFYG